MRFGKSSLVAAAVVLLALGSSRSRADLLLSVQQVGSNVVVTGSGTAITTGLSSPGSGFSNAILAPDLDALTVGPPTNQSSTDYFGVTGPSNFGTGNSTLASSGTGQGFGLDSAGSTLLLLVPSSYTSGAILAGTSTYSNMTFSSLGITPGTYLYSFGSGATADFLTIQVGPAAPPAPTVPEPDSLALLIGMGASGAGFLVRRRKQAHKVA